MKIVIIDYGAGNVFSVQTALQRLGYKATVSCGETEIRQADRVIFPGVGQASAAMDRLKKTGLDGVIPRLTVPVLGICLGMQLMCAYTEEERTEGLGIFPLNVKKMSGLLKVPHMGWNTIFDLESNLMEGIGPGERVYFVHSYYVPDSSYTIARCEYSFPFAAAVRKDNFYGCQFHPEKSAGIGERILKNFLMEEICE